MRANLWKSPNRAKGSMAKWQQTEKGFKNAGFVPNRQILLLSVRQPLPAHTSPLISELLISGTKPKSGGRAGHTSMNITLVLKFKYISPSV